MHAEKKRNFLWLMGPVLICVIAPYTIGVATLLYLHDFNISIQIPVGVDTSLSEVLFGIFLNFIALD